MRCPIESDQTEEGAACRSQSVLTCPAEEVSNAPSSETVVPFPSVPADSNSISTVVLSPADTLPVESVSSETVALSLDEDCDMFSATSGCPEEAASLMDGTSSTISYTNLVSPPTVSAVSSTTVLSSVEISLTEGIDDMEVSFRSDSLSPSI